MDSTFLPVFLLFFPPSHPEPDPSALVAHSLARAWQINPRDDCMHYTALHCAARTLILHAWPCRFQRAAGRQDHTVKPTDRKVQSSYTDSGFPEPSSDPDTTTTNGKDETRRDHSTPHHTTQQDKISSIATKNAKRGKISTPT